MRTAYKAWSGIAATTFVLVVAVQCSSDREAINTPAPKAASFARTGVVNGFGSPANLRLVDGRLIHVPMLNGINVVDGYGDACEQQAADDTVRAMLGGKTVTLTAPPRTRDARSAVPAGYVEADVTVDGADYARTFEQRYYSAAFNCIPVEAPAPTEPGPVSSSGGVDVDHDDTNHRDGAATGSFCKRRWWC